MKIRLLVIICLIGVLLIPVNSIQALPVFLDCTYDSDFIISTNKLEFVPDETFVLNIKTVQNDNVFEVIVIDPKGNKVFADVVDADKNNYAQTRFHVPDNALKGTWSVFVTANPSHKQEVIFIGVDETPQPTLSVKPSFVNHKYKVDDASFLLAGKPDTDIQVNVLDPNDEIMHVYIVPLALEGKCNFILDLDEYKPGVYTVGVSDHTDDATTVFTVGLPSITGAIAVNLFSDSYFFGDDIFVSIDTAPEIDLTIEVKDPSGNIIHQLDATSEKNGTFHTSVRLPDYGKNGTWVITARYGANFDTQEFKVALNPQEADSPRTPSGSFSPDKTVYPTPWEDRSPLQQFKDGIDPKAIQCKDELVLIQKYDDSPACVSPETREKLIERGWMHIVSADLTLNDGQSWGYIKNVLILGNGYVGITMSYPTNDAYHELYPDESNSIVGNCDVQNDSANLSILHLNDIDSDANTITFTKENKNFDGMSCDDAFWEEMTRRGYCGPPPHLMSQRETLMSLTDAQNIEGFVLVVPKYLPEGYDVQKIMADGDKKHVTLFISPMPVTNETDMCKFTWNDGGIRLSYVSLPEDAPRFSNDPDRERITINENRGYVKYREIGDRAGTPIPQGSEITWHIPEGNLVLNMYSSISSEELIKIAESIE